MEYDIYYYNYYYTFIKNKLFMKKSNSNDPFFLKKKKIQRKEPIKLILKRNLKMFEKYGINFLTAGIHINNVLYYVSSELNNDVQQIKSSTFISNDIIIPTSISNDINPLLSDSNELKIATIKTNNIKSGVIKCNDAFYSYDRNLWFSASPCNINTMMPLLTPVVNKNNISNIINYPIGTYIYVATPGEEWTLYILRQALNNYIKNNDTDNYSISIKMNNWASSNPIAIKNRETFASVNDKEIFTELKNFFGIKGIRSITLIKKDIIPDEFIKFLL